MGNSIIKPLLVTLFATMSVLSASDESSLDRQIGLRVELYDLDKATALRLQQETSGLIDNENARQEVLQMVDRGEASLVTTAPLTSHTNQRAKHSDTDIFTVVADFTWNEDAQQLVPEFKTREVGTIFEVDPSIEGDMIEANFSLEHHTAPPTEQILKVPFPGSAESMEVSVKVFHEKKIIKRITLMDGASALVAAFQITGVDSAQDKVRVAFLCANLLK